MERKIQDQCLLLYSRRVIHYREKEKEKKKKNETRKRTSKLTNNP